MATAILRMRALLNSALELVRAKEALYVRINELFKIAGLFYQPDLVRPLALPQENYRARAGKRTVYIWSDFFNKTPNQQIFDLLFTKGIDRVLLSHGKKTNAVKAKAFVSKASKQGIQLELIVGDNQWIHPEKQPAVISAVKHYAELSEWIHLDIEPHTLPGYRSNRKAYLDNYLVMLEKIRQQLTGNKLSVALPTHWPDDVYLKINGLVDKVYLMSYEANEFSRQQSRLKRLFDVLDKNKTVVVLNMKEFEDEWEFESLIEALNKGMRINEFGIHQISNYLQ